MRCKNRPPALQIPSFPELGVFGGRAVRDRSELVSRANPPGSKDRSVTCLSGLRTRSSRRNRRGAARLQRTEESNRMSGAQRFQTLLPTVAVLRPATEVDVRPRRRTQDASVCLALCRACRIGSKPLGFALSSSAHEWRPRLEPLHQKLHCHAQLRRALKAHRIHRPYIGRLQAAGKHL